jgi:hypothetical protein
MPELSWQAREPEAEAAADWWASRLGNCHHDTVGLDAPRRALTVADMETAIEMNLRVKRGKYDDNQVAVFQIALSVVLADHLATCTQGYASSRSHCSTGRHVVFCDWDPDGTLVRAAERAGIDLDSDDLPRKTTMIIKPGETIQVSEGYGAPYITIWPPDAAARELADRERLP